MTTTSCSIHGTRRGMGRTRGRLANPSLLVDYREEHSRVPVFLHALGCTVELVPLEVGDVVVSTHIGVERKSAADLRQSWRDGSLIQQCYELRKSFSKPLLVVELGATKERSRARSQAIVRTLWRLFPSAAIPVRYVENPEATAALLAELARSAGCSTRPRPPKTSFFHRRTWIVCHMFAANPAHAEWMLRKHKSIDLLLRFAQTDSRNELMLAPDSRKFFKEVFCGDRAPGPYEVPWWTTTHPYWVKPEVWFIEAPDALPRWIRRLFPEINWRSPPSLDSTLENPPVDDAIKRATALTDKLSSDDDDFVLL